MPRKTKSTSKSKHHKRNSTKTKKKQKKRKGTHLQKILNIPGLSAEITKHLSIPQVKTFRTLSKQTRNNKYITKQLKKRSEELSNETIDVMLQRILFIKKIPNHRVNEVFLSDFVSSEHFDDEGDMQELKEMYPHYDSDDEQLFYDYQLDKYREDYIMIQHYNHPSPRSQYIVYCPHFKRSDLQTLNATSFSSTKGYDRFRKVLKSHIKNRDFRVYRLLPDYEKKTGGYERIKLYTFKLSFDMIPSIQN